MAVAIETQHCDIRVVSCCWTDPKSRRELMEFSARQQSLKLSDWVILTAVHSGMILSLFII